jgi:MinD superfamily P-loop ATPase
MHEIVVLSGKGGTGKTSLTAAFAHLTRDAIVCDLDVDAPDLHLLLEPEPYRSEAFVSGHEAVVAADRCDGCGLCVELCRFGAVVPDEGGCRIDPLKCEGCKLCVALCPAGAIDFPPKNCGRWYLSKTRFGTMVHAQLHPGEENSGRLVALLRQQARRLASAEDRSLILSDGPPGIGCPVISSLSATDLAVVVSEPTPSGFHDLERVIELCRHFRVPAAVIVNKHDLNPGLSAGIEDWCRADDIPLLARVPFDKRFVEAMLAARTVTETGGPAAEALAQAWKKTMALLAPRQAA